MYIDSATDDLLPPTKIVNCRCFNLQVFHLQIAFIAFSLVAYVFAIGLNISLAVNHLTDGNVWFFVQTVISILVPAFIMTGFNTYWYKIDSNIPFYKVSSEQWMIRIVFIIFMLAPLLRNFEALCYGIKSIRSKKEVERNSYYRKMVHFSNDASFLIMFDAFLGLGPQVILQIYIFAQLQKSEPNIFTITEMIQVATIFKSLLSMSAAVVFYLRSLRICLFDKEKLNISASVVLTLWRFFDITSRVIALGLFASIFPYYLLLICLIHYCAMFTWMRALKTDFCESNKIGEFIYNMVLGVIFVFCYFNPKDNPTQRRIIFFYTLMLLENTALISVWYYYYPPNIDFRLPALILQILSFALSILFMVIYYYFLHPTVGKFCHKCQIANNRIETELDNYDVNNTSACEKLNSEEPNET